MKHNTERDNLIRQDYHRGNGRILANWYEISPSRISQIVHYVPTLLERMEHDYELWIQPQDAPQTHYDTREPSLRDKIRDCIKRWINRG